MPNLSLSLLFCSLFRNKFAFGILCVQGPAAIIHLPEALFFFHTWMHFFLLLIHCHNPTTNCPFFFFFNHLLELKYNFISRGCQKRFFKKYKTKISINQVRKFNCKGLFHLIIYLFKRVNLNPGF